MTVQKGKLFLIGDRSDLWGTKYGARYSASPFDAKAFKSDEAEKEKAKKIGGVVRLFDAVNGDLI